MARTAPRLVLSSGAIAASIERNCVIEVSLNRSLVSGRAFGRRRQNTHRLNLLALHVDKAKGQRDFLAGPLRKVIAIQPSDKFGIGFIENQWLHAAVLKVDDGA